MKKITNSPVKIGSVRLILIAAVLLFAASLSLTAFADVSYCSVQNNTAGLSPEKDTPAMFRAAYQISSPADPGLQNTVEMIRQQAAEAYLREGYGAAIAVINRGLAMTGSNAELLALRSQYEAIAPQLLMEMEPFYSSFQSYARQTGITLSDKLGNSYDNCIEYIHGMKDLWDDAEDIYVLNYRYSYLQGTLFVPKERSSKYDDWYSEGYHFRIYGDGKLLYTSPNMISTQYPVNFNVNISGVDQLKFMWNGGSPTWDVEIGLANAYLFK